MAVNSIRARRAKRDHLWPAFDRKVKSGGGGGTWSGPLDLVGGAIGAYSSARRLGWSYGGPLLRIRRDSDNAEQDFYALANGDLDVKAAATFIGGATGFIKTLYDQSLNSTDATQATTANQPQYVAGAANSKSVARFDGTSDTLVTTLNDPAAISMFAVARQDATANNTEFLVSSNTTQNRYAFLVQGAGGANALGFVLRNTVPTTFQSARSPAPVNADGFFVQSGTFDGTSLIGYFNGVASPTTTFSGTPAVAAAFAIAARGGLSFFGGDVTEVIFYGTVLSAADRALIERNQGAAYGVAVS